MKIKEFSCNCDSMADTDSSSKNIAQYMKRALERGDAIYFYAREPLQNVRHLDKLSWIKDIKHEEYDMISIQWSSGRKLYYQSKLLSDKVVKLDLTDKDVKKVFDDKFKIGTTWTKKVGKGDPLFDTHPGYEIRDFIVTKDDDVIMDAVLHGYFQMAISKEIVDEVDKECKEKGMRKWIRRIFPFFH